MLAMAWPENSEQTAQMLLDSDIAAGFEITDEFERLSYADPGSCARMEPLTATLFMAVSGGGRIVKRLVVKGPF